VTLTVGSLFAGIGGLELGLERAGMEVVWQVESDPCARRVLRKHWPRVTRFEDVRYVHDNDRCNEARCGKCLEPVDLICGGFPCQDISVAGKGAGLAGERSGLWKEFARIVDEVRPSWVLIENVPALRSRGLGTVLRDLSALGFNAEWDCLPASAFGASHRRDRIFVVAYAQREHLRLQPRRWRRTDGQDSIFALATSQTWEPPQSPLWPPLTDLGRSVHGLPNRVDRLRCLGNAVVPQVAEHVGRLIVAANALIKAGDK